MTTLRQLEPIRVSEDASLDAFASPALALAHVCDHVLTHPETWWWTLFIRDYPRHVLPPSDPDGTVRRQFAAALWETPTPPEAQTLCEQYRREIETALTDAFQLKWFWRKVEGRRTDFCGIGTSGLRVGWNWRRVKTAFFTPYPVTAVLTSADPEKRRLDPLPREPRHVPANRYVPPAGDAAARYVLFCRCAISVRRKYSEALRNKNAKVSPASGRGVPSRVPTFAQWEQFCERVRGEHGADMPVEERP